MDKTQQYICMSLARILAADVYASIAVEEWIVFGNIDFPFLDDLVWC